MKKIIIISALLFTVISAFAGEDETSNCLSIDGGNISKISMVGSVDVSNEQGNSSESSRATNQ